VKFEASFYHNKTILLEHYIVSSGLIDCKMLVQFSKVFKE